MAQFNRKKHWETIYQTKELNTVSWYEPTTETSLRFIEESKLPKNAKIIDVGGGDSLLVDHLLKKVIQILVCLIFRKPPYNVPKTGWAHKQKVLNGL